MSSLVKVLRLHRMGHSQLAVLVAGLLTQPAAWTAEYLREDFESYSTIGDAMSKGPWIDANTGGTATHGLAIIPGANGANTKAYYMTIVGNEDAASMAFKFPGAVAGNNSTGVSHFFMQWKEKRSSNYDFGADKSCRAYGRQSNGNVNLDVIMGFIGTNNMVRDTVITDSGTVGVFGQGLGNDSEFFFVPFSWDRTRWYTIEWEIQLNDVGKTNGYIKMWIDGREIGKKENIAIREGSDTYTFQEIRIGGWESGGKPAVPSTRYLDDVVISTSYIGVAADASRPKAPTSLIISN